MRLSPAPFAMAAAALAVLAVPASAQAPPRTVSSVDLQKYVGRWYEIARFPNRFQKQCAGDVVVDYASRPDGRIDVVNRCRKTDGSTIEAAGVARRAGADTSNAKLEVRFAPAWLSFLPVWGDYWILDLAGDYTWAIVGDRDREYLWFLSRTPTVQDERFEAMKRSAEAQGFDVSRLLKTTNRVD